MEKKSFISNLNEAFEENGMSGLLSEESRERLFEFAVLLVEENKKYNLTAITDPDGIILKHFVDCAAVTEHICSHASVIDVGCGAGFPSIPIAILRSDVTVTSIDSTAKKINFINEVSKRLSLNRIHGITCRAEDHAKTHREAYDVSISRAVARLNVLSELCIPLTKLGGHFIAMKSSRSPEELSEAQKGISILGARLIRERSSVLTYKDESISRETLVFQKEKETPAQYPRNYSQITKKPL